MRGSRGVQAPLPVVLPRRLPARAATTESRRIAEALLRGPPVSGGFAQQPLPPGTATARPGRRRASTSSEEADAVELPVAATRPRGGRGDGNREPTRPRPVSTASRAQGPWSIRSTLIERRTGGICLPAPGAPTVTATGRRRGWSGELGRLDRLGGLPGSLPRGLNSGASGRGRTGPRSPSLAGGGQRAASGRSAAGVRFRTCVPHRSRLGGAFHEPQVGA